MNKIEIGVEGALGKKNMRKISRWRFKVNGKKEKRKKRKEGKNPH